MPTLEERLIAKVTSKPAEKPAIPTITESTNKPKALETNNKINVTGKAQSYEDLCKALGIPVKKKLTEK